MKAIVLAGGEGRRLRPITENRPKPMVRLLDRPVLAHTVELLKRYGVTEICMTLGYLPGEITGYFGDGSAFGVSIETRIEETPLGTAGGVRACADFIGDSDFIVISGDAVCSLDLGACMEAHKSTGAEATILLCANAVPTEYGLVTTRGDGRVEGFLEKPAWERVVTDCVNTGIYILSPAVLDSIPEGKPYDFARDLFPEMLRTGRRIYGWRGQGYWCDIGSPESYLQCCMDALEGRIGLEIPAHRLRAGVWSEAPLEDSFETVIPPVFIGRDVTVAPGARLGPGVILNSGSRVGAGAVLRGSVIDGAAIGDGADITGAVICTGAAIGSRAVVKEGAVIGERTVVGKNSLVAERVRIWPERQLPEAARITENIVSGMLRGDLQFGAGGRIDGEFGLVLSPEACLALGGAAAVAGRVGVCWGGGDAARILASAVSCGVCAAGGEAVETDSGFAAGAAFAGRQLDLPLTIFARQDGGAVSLQLFGAHGMPLAREEERKLEAGLAGDVGRAACTRAGKVNRISGMAALHTAAIARETPPCGGLTVAVQGRGAACRALRETLSACGCTVSEKHRGIPVFTVSEDGMTLAAEDEAGRYLDEEQVQVMTAAVEFERGSGTVAAAYTAPAALDVLARDMGTVLLRLERDGAAAEQMYRRQIFLRDGIAAAAKLCGALAAGGETLAELHARMPRFGSVTREVGLTGDRGAVMRALAAACTAFSADITDGLTVSNGRGTAHITPCREKNALRIRAESEDTELAEELCGYFERIARRTQAEER